MKLAEAYPKAVIAEALGIARSRFYRQPRQRDETALHKQVACVAEEFVRYGQRRLCAEMKRRGTAIGRVKMRRIMDRLGIAQKPHRRRTRTTHSQHEFRRHPNRVEGMSIEKPHQVWVSDITYIWLKTEFVYLAVVMDVFTRQIVGWQLSRQIDTTLTLAALNKALSSYDAPTIHHSDQGVQYAATGYINELTKHQILPSMAAVGCPEQNGYAERLMRTIKEEHVSLVEYRSFADAQTQMGRFIDEVYQHKRMHSSLGYLTPVEFAAQYDNQRPTTNTDVVF